MQGFFILTDIGKIFNLALLNWAMKSSDYRKGFYELPFMNAFYMRIFFIVWDTMGKEELPVVIKINKLNLITRERLNLEMDRLEPLEKVETPLNLSMQETLLYYTVIYFHREIYKTDIAREGFESIKKKVGRVDVSFSIFKKNSLSLFTKLMNYHAMRMKDYTPFEERKRLLDNHFIVN